jgi:hypothetical protein
MISRRALSLFALSTAIVAAGCGGQNSNSAMGGSSFNSLDRPGGAAALNSGRTGPTTPNAAAWPIEEDKPFVMRAVDLGTPQLDGEYKGEKFDPVFKDIAGIGFNVVRVQLPVGAFKRDKDGRINGVQDAALRNLSDLASRAESAKLKLYIVLGGEFPTGDKQISPFVDKKAHEAFGRGVASQVGRTLKDKPGVLAFSLLADIDAAKQGDVAGFLREASRNVKLQDPKRLVTAGVARNGWQAFEKGEYGELGLDFFDVGIFDERGEFPPARNLGGGRPIVVGAIPRREEAEENVQAAKSFVGGAIDRGYAGFVLWDYKHLVDKDGKHLPVVAALKPLLADARAARADDRE